MDLIEEDQRELIFKERCKQLEKLSLPLECKCFSTSIWDETLYKVCKKTILKGVFLQLRNVFEFPAKTIFTNISTGNILPLVDPLVGPE